MSVLSDPYKNSPANGPWGRHSDRSTSSSSKGQAQKGSAAKSSQRPHQRPGVKFDPDRPARVDPRTLPRLSPEALTAQLLQSVVGQGVSLDAALGRVLSQAQPVHRGLVQAMGYEVLRHYEALVFWRDSLLQRPIPAKSAIIALLLLVGLERIRGARREASRSVNSTVQAARELGHPWATGLLNAVLRRAARQIEEGVDPFAGASPADTARLPGWLFDALAVDWGEERASNLGVALATHPPMTLRVAGDRRAYGEQLASMEIETKPTVFSTRGLNLVHPMDVDRLPGFSEGQVSVQDEAAQWVVDLLDLAPGQQVLDACSAPGGKTLAMLQHQSEASVTAVDIDTTRMARVQENLERGRVFARLIVGDAGAPQRWWDGQPFDRILADVPCSATGVIRRHPDIKRLRRPNDLPVLVERQAAILDALWSLLKPGGRMVYATCSILDRENAVQVASFLRRHRDASALPMSVDWGEPRQTDGQFLGRQVFPVAEGHDGFFYAVLEKN